MLESPKIQAPRVVAVTKRKRDGAVTLSSKENQTNTNALHRLGDSTNNTAAPNAIVYSMDAFGNIEITSGSMTPKIKSKTKNTDTLVERTRQDSQQKNPLPPPTKTIPDEEGKSNNLKPTTAHKTHKRLLSIGSRGTFHLVEHIDDKDEDEEEEERDYEVIEKDRKEGRSALEQENLEHTHQNRTEHSPFIEVEYENSQIKRADNLVSRTQQQINPKTIQQSDEQEEDRNNATDSLGNNPSIVLPVQPIVHGDENGVYIEHLNSKGHRPPPVSPKPNKEEIARLKGPQPSELLDDNGDPLYAPVTKITKTKKQSEKAKSDSSSSATAQTQLHRVITTSELTDENGDALYAPVILSKPPKSSDHVSVNRDESSTDEWTHVHSRMRSTTSENVSVFSDSGLSSPDNVSPVDPFMEDDEPIYAMPEVSPTSRRR